MANRQDSARAPRTRVRVANRRAGGWLWRLPLALVLWGALAAPMVAGGVALVTLRRWARDLPPVPDLVRWQAEAPRTSLVRAADGAVLTELPFAVGVEVGHRQPLRLDEVPRTLVQAVLAAEDLRFARHGGVDYAAIARAAWVNLRAGRVVEGASTIAQQVARNLLPEDIGYQRTLRRKVREALMARQLERRWSKAAILEVYLSYVFLGGNAYGMAAAARAYFGAELGSLRLAQHALLAGLIQAPSRLDPLRHPEAARRRRDEVLARMRRAGMIDADTAARAAAEPLGLAPPAARPDPLPWASEAARQIVAEALPQELARGGLELELATAVAPGLQLAERAQVHRRRWQPRGAPEAPEVAALWWDLRTGYVEVLLGGASWSTSQFDRIRQACRQPGSAWKTLVYGAALQSAAITPGTPLLDAPVTEYDEVENVFWKPKSGGHFRGVVLAEDAFAASLNAPAIDVLGRVGGANVIALARQLGVTTELADVGPLALGASCVRPLELARAYAVVARSGWGLVPRLVVRVRRGQEVLFDAAAPEDPWLAPDRRLDRLAQVAGLPPDRRAGAPARGPLLDERIAYQLQHMLRAVVERGTATAARLAGREVAGKTGTTNDNTDAWFIGYSRRVLGVAWLGFDDPKRKLPPHGDGAHAALPLWLDGLRAVEGQRPRQPVLPAPPTGLERVRIDRETGLRAVGGGLELWLREGSAPEAEAQSPSAAPADFDRTSREF